ncbi:hypothetical protein, partial [Streptomyces formicae]
GRGTPKRCLIPNPREQKYLENLTSLLELGAATAYPIIEEEIEIDEYSKTANSPTEEHKIRQMELTEAAYEAILWNEKSLWVTERHLIKTRLIYRCVMAITDYNTPPPPPYQAPDTDDDKRYIRQRITLAYQWANRLKRSGEEISQTLRLAHVMAIYLYTGNLYLIMNNDNFFTRSILQDELWPLVLSDIETGQVASFRPPFMHYPAFLELFDAASKSAGAARVSALKKLRAEFTNRRTWDAVADEANMHVRMVARALRNIPTVPASDDPDNPDDPKTYRGGWCLHLPPDAPGQPGMVKKSFTTTGLFSTSSRLQVALRFARKQHDKPLRRPALAELTDGLYVGKSVSGLSVNHEEAEFIVPRDVKFKRESVREEDYITFKCIYAVHKKAGG